ncbi:MAG: YjbQ family protein [Clostridiaceae bacterium]|nr:YjbQ family protein [Clostridiaceae bacterium]
MIVPENLLEHNIIYNHARMLKSYGSTAGNHCVFPIVNGEIVKGDAQEIYFVNLMGLPIEA